MILPQSELCLSQCENGSADQRIRDLELRKAAEIAIGGPKLLYAVLQAKRRDARVTLSPL